jgi:segregation and condensation protein A
MQETLAQQPQTVVVDHTPLHVHMDSVLERLRRTSPLSLADLFNPPHTRSRLVGLFLAILELAKGGQILPAQGERCGEIVVALA